MKLSTMTKAIAVLSIFLTVKPAFAHQGDHAGITVLNLADHLANSPFHMVLISLALLAGLAIGLTFVPLSFKRLLIRPKK